MASRLTDEQKALHKEARNARNRAYSARSKAYFDEKRQADEASLQGPVAQAMQRASEAIDRALEQHNAARRALEARLQAQIQALETEFEVSFKQLRQARDATRAEWNAKREQDQLAIEAKYADIANCWGPAAWKPIEDFLPQTAAAGEAQAAPARTTSRADLRLVPSTATDQCGEAGEQDDEASELASRIVERTRLF